MEGTVKGRAAGEGRRRLGQERVVIRVTGSPGSGAVIRRNIVNALLWPV